MIESGKKRFEHKFGNSVSEITADVNLRFKKKKRQFYDFYGSNYATMERVRQSFHNLMFLMTNQLENGAPKVLSRIKDRKECVRKFETKYRTKAEKDGNSYNIEEYITDLIGVRVVCLYEDDVAKVKDVIEKNFSIIDMTDKTKTLLEVHDRFGYKGLHVNIGLDPKRSKLPEYRGFENFQVEIQLRSIVQDAWSEIDHKLKYKKSIPNELQRRIIRIAALFELADQEFTHIRKNTEVLETLSEFDSHLATERTMDSFSFISVMKKHFSNYNFDNEPDSESAKKIDGFVEEITVIDSEMTDEGFRGIMDEYLPKIQPYVTEIEGRGFRMNPYTITRHILFWSDPNVFTDILYEGQKSEFEGWLNNNAKESENKTT